MRRSAKIGRFSAGIGAIGTFCVVILHKNEFTFLTQTAGGRVSAVPCPAMYFGSSAALERIDQAQLAAAFVQDLHHIHGRGGRHQQAFGQAAADFSSHRVKLVEIAAVRPEHLVFAPLRTSFTRLAEWKK